MMRQKAHKETKLAAEAKEIASKLAKQCHGVITGGGTGIMEAGNKGAHHGGGHEAAAEHGAEHH